VSKEFSQEKLKEIFKNMSNEQLDLLQVVSKKVMDFISSGKNLHFFEVLASDTFYAINEVKIFNQGITK
jgi:hypothetical protein